MCVNFARSWPVWLALLEDFEGLGDCVRAKKDRLERNGTSKTSKGKEVSSAVHHLKIAAQDLQEGSAQCETQLAISCILLKTQVHCVGRSAQVKMNSNNFDKLMKEVHNLRLNNGRSRRF